jgi:hypothetical protein
VLDLAIDNSTEHRAQQLPRSRRAVTVTVASLRAAFLAGSPVGELTVRFLDGLVLAASVGNVAQSLLRDYAEKPDSSYSWRKTACYRLIFST